MPEPEKGPSRKPEEVLADLEKKLASIDGIATSDAFALGRLVQEYGQACSIASMGNFLGPLMKTMLGPKPGDEPWRPGKL